MARGLLLLLIWVIQVLLVAVFSSATWLQKQISTEKSNVETYLGADTAQHISEKADQSFQSLFVDTGVMNGLYAYLIPDPNIPKHGTDGLAPWFFSWLEDSLSTFWWVIYQAVYRLFLFSEWMPYLGVLVLAAIVDGLVARQIRRKNLAYANPVRFRAGLRLLLLLAAVPLLYLTAPFSVTPLLVPGWMFAASAVLMLVAANAQHRI